MVDRHMAESGPEEVACIRDGGDRSAQLALLVRDHYQALYRFAYRLTGSASDAEDLTQETFLIVQRKLHQLREHDRVGAWLYTVLRSCFLKSIRRRRPRPPADAPFDPESLPVSTSEETPFDGDRLQQALAELPDEFRLVLVMYYFEDYSYREMAEQLDLPLGTVMSRLSRAKAHLRRQLAPVAEEWGWNG